MLLLGSVACGGGEDPGPGGDPRSDLVTTTESDGIFTSTIDAADRDEWVYLSLSSGGMEVFIGDPLQSNDWDLGFRRSNIRLNGGASGGAMGGVVPLANVQFSSVSQAPLEGWITDEAVLGEQPDDGSPVANDGIDFAFTRATNSFENGWFLYDPATRVLSPAPIIWVVRGGDDSYFAVEIFDWYSPAGSAAFWTITWKPITPPSGIPQPGFAINASSSTTAVYVDLLENSVVKPSNPTQSTDWDLAFIRTQILTNSTLSGEGVAGAQLVPAEETFANVSSSPTSGFLEDTLLPIPGPPGSGDALGNPALAEWFDYDSTNRVVTPKDATFLVRGATGDYFKFRILEWDDGMYRLEAAPLAVEPDIYQLTVDASSREVPVTVNLRLGEVVQTASTSTGWDLMIRRTVIQTNSGVSGDGQGGAQIIPSASQLDELETALTDGYVVDELLTSGQPGVPAAPTNPVLGAWFNYDEVNHVVSPKAEIYAVRTADGGYAAIRILSYSDGVYTLEGIYAGADRGRFK